MVDLSIWHFAPSLLLPALVINKYVHFTAKLIRNINVSDKFIKYGPTVSALCLIPFIVHPIDHFTDWAMDQTFRQYFNYKEYDELPLEPHQVIQLPEYIETKETRRH